LQKVQRNPTQSVLHPFQKAREYKRALNAAKLEKVFAKPFLAALNNHSDGIYSIAKNKFNLRDMLTGSADGEIIFWNLPDQKAQFSINAH
jgi:WD repeat and SOF domain-containing protein 1